MSGEYIAARGDKVKEVILEQNSKQAPSAKMQLQQNSKQGSTKRFNAIAVANKSWKHDGQVPLGRAAMLVMHPGPWKAQSSPLCGAHLS